MFSVATTHDVNYDIDTIRPSRYNSSHATHCCNHTTQHKTNKKKIMSTQINQPLAINDRVMIAGKPYRVYNILDELELVCFGAISPKTGKDLSSKNPQNIRSLKFDVVDRYLKLKSIVKQ